MKHRDYDRVKHCCKHCGMLMPLTEKDLDNHTPEECLKVKFFNEQRQEALNAN